MAQTEHKQGFTEEQALSVISDIVQGLLHIHMSEPSVAFRDLNVRFTSNHLNQNACRFSM